jgi:hypothetical protein
MSCEFDGNTCLLERVELLEQKLDFIDPNVICGFITRCNEKLDEVLSKLDNSENKLMLQNIEILSNQCVDNMNRLNHMMKEMKGLVCMVRANAAKNEWYGDEVDVPVKQDVKQIES